MDRNVILEKVQEIFRDCFDDESLILSWDTNSDDIEDWDSLAQVNIIVSLEKVFSIKFSVDEIIKLQSVGDIVDTIAKKL
ncbi:acyl carrier protein [Clostridium paridis]|uniref:Acyl carrier protein n=1 Tax=Clostridium paridis TaxID=2803863 RepID=A0A937FCE6_9CLOT|nr:acyl carrier protein [Clostridium paridis]MBL4930559.1 acyl carrier protein [Clostridium paridis]